MLPTNTEYEGPEDEIEDDFTEEDFPSKTYWMDRKNKRILGTCDGSMALEQAAFKILNTERGESPVYSEDFGIELEDMYGENIIYAESELSDRIREALLQDDRFDRIEDMEVTRSGRRLAAKYNIVSADGNLIDREEEIDV